MAKPEDDASAAPLWDDTKLAKTSFGKLMSLYTEAKARESEAAEAAAEYKAQMSALMLKTKTEAARVEGFVARWVKGGTRRALVPELLLEAGVTPPQLARGYRVTETADFFGIYGPRKGRGEDQG